MTGQAFLAVAGNVAVFGSWLFTARWLYRRWRHGGSHELLFVYDPVPVLATVLAACFAAMFWPLFILGLLVTAGHPPTDAERRRKLLEREKAVAAAEAELARAESLQRRAQGS